MANKKLLAAVLVVLLAAVAVVAVWYMYRYDAGVLALTFETTPPLMESPLSGANYSWEAKAYTVRNFGNAPFDG